MTGYGTAALDHEKANLSVEVKTLNSKFLDLHLKLPKEFADKEYEIRQLITTELKRGKVSVVLEYTPKSESGYTLRINEAILESGYEKLKAFASQRSIPTDNIMARLLQLPEVLAVEEDASVGIDWDLIRQCLLSAISQCNAFRKQEGEALHNQVIDNIRDISKNLQAINLQDPARIEKIKNRIRGNLEEFVGKENIDSNRFEQELIYYIEKLDISEEKTRLANHLEYFEQVLTSEDMPGKKLGFISQEIGREINTIGSKASDSIIQQHVVQMKEELEKIKEQLLNIV